MEDYSMFGDDAPLTSAVMTSSGSVITTQVHAPPIAASVQERNAKTASPVTQQIPSPTDDQVPELAGLTTD